MRLPIRIAAGGLAIVLGAALPAVSLLAQTPLIEQGRASISRGDSESAIIAAVNRR